MSYVNTVYMLYSAFEFCTFMYDEDCVTIYLYSCSHVGLANDG